MVVEGGKIKHSARIGFPRGSRVAVENMFFNTRRLGEANYYTGCRIAQCGDGRIFHGISRAHSHVALILLTITGDTPVSNQLAIRLK